MQRTYGRRALQRRSGVQSHPSDPRESDDHPLNDRSPPWKRRKVFVEIVSPKRKKPCEDIQTRNQSPPSVDTQKLNVSDVEPTATLLESTSRSLPGSPKTPERSPKDFSFLFTTPSHHPPSGSQPKRGSIVKRMLGRSRTESSLEVTPSAELPSVTTAMARQRSSQSLPTFPEREATPEVSSQSSPNPLQTRNIKTYAGSSRSFLVALPVPDADPLYTVEDDVEPHDSYADLRTRWGIDPSEDDMQPYQFEQVAVPTPLGRNASESSQPSLSVGMMNDLKSITELRSKGESRRFSDEVGYLFESLDGSSALGLRRASAFEIVNKLCDPGFNRRAKTSDFYVRTWDKLWIARAGTNDKIFDATIAMFAALAARDPHTITEVAQQEKFIPTLVEILSSLDHRKDIFASVLASSSDDDLKSHGIMRTEITALKSLASVVSRESISSSLNQPSTRFFVSHSLAVLPASLLSGQYLPTLLANLRAELSLMEPRIAAYESGILLNRGDMPSLYHIEACLRLLDSYLLGMWSSASGHSSGGLPRINEFTAELMLLCIASSSFLEETGEDVIIVRRCLCGAMRVLTLLSHDDPWWCSAAMEVSDALPFAAMTVMRSQVRWSESRNVIPQKSSAEAFDLLCLALGLVMNWATLSPQVAVHSRTKSINPMCSGSHLCVRACCCPGKKSILECFIMLHIQYSDSQEDSSECAFLKGYTAILLGLLIKGCPSNQALITSMLPGALPSDGIQSLVTCCYSFLDLYDNSLGLLSSDPLHGFTHEDPGYQRKTWDQEGKQVAQSVIVFLKQLCNT